MSSKSPKSLFFATLLAPRTRRKAADAARAVRKHIALAEQIAAAAEQFGADVEAGNVSIVIGKSGLTLMRHVVDEAQARKRAPKESTAPQVGAPSTPNGAKAAKGKSA